MWSKLLTAIIGALIDKIPALISLIYKKIEQSVKRNKKEKENEKKIQEFKDAQDKDSVKDSFTKLP